MKNKFSWALILIFVFLFFGYQYYNNNIDKILCSKADNYYSKNNIEKAQEYYEKAFAHGCNDSKNRIKYVNSIINSPVTVKSQEQLVKFLETSIDDVASSDAKCFLEDIKREIYKKYYGNYITNAVLNQQVVRWGNSPITFTFINSQNVPQYFVEEIRNAFKEWESATDKDIQFAETDNSANIMINFSENNPADNSDKKYIVAYTTPKIELDKLNKMEIKFYLKDAEGNYFSQNQVYNTALHEIAHAIGFMGHCTDRENIMYLTKDLKSVIEDFREELTHTDIITMKLLYKIKPQITNIEDLNSEYIPSIALGSLEEISEDKFEEALTYVQSAPELPSGYIDLAENYLLKKDYKKAIKNLQKALRLAETEDIKSLIYYNLAVVYFYSNEIEKSKKYLLNSMAVSYSDEKQYLYAEMLAKEGSTKESINEYIKLIQRNPNNIEYTIGLTNLYVNQKDFLNARKTLKNYIKNNPVDKNNPRFSPYGFIKIGL